MTIIQILLIVFFIFAISRVLSRYRGQAISGTAAVLWSIFWIIGGIVVLLPNTTFYLARFVGVGRGVDVVVYITIALLFFMVFRILIQLRRIERNITTLTRHLALDQENNKTIKQ